MSLPLNPYIWVTAAVLHLSAVASPQGPLLSWALLRDKAKNRLELSQASAGHKGKRKRPSTNGYINVRLQPSQRLCCFGDPDTRGLNKKMFYFYSNPLEIKLIFLLTLWLTDKTNSYSQPVWFSVRPQWHFNIYTTYMHTRLSLITAVITCLFFSTINRAQ